MIAAHAGLPADALAYFHGPSYVIVLNLALPVSVRGWLADQLLALVDPLAADLGVRIPLGAAELMYLAPLASG